MTAWSIVLGLALGGVACQRRPGADARVAASAATLAAAEAGGAPKADDGYVGAARCAECHAKKHAAWEKTWHARALSRPTRGRVAGDFADAHFAGSSSQAWMSRSSTSTSATESGGDRYVMRTHGSDGALADFPVDWLIGGKRMQDDVTIFADGRWQVLPVYFQVTQRRWVDYTESKQGPLTPDHPFFWANFRRMANRECLDCHVTGLRVRYAPTTQRWSTEFVDAGVACEDCHGPGARHAESTLARDIFNPGQAAPDAALSLCAQCHGPRNPLFPLLDVDHRFRPGQRYGDFYDPIVVTIAGRQSGDFFADGRPRSSSFEYQALLQSQCYRRGGATCLTCHAAPHDAQKPDELRVAGDETCRRCHAAQSAGVRAHSKHATKAAQSCVACHMPKLVSGVLDHFADHTIDVPSPANSARHDVANACGLCHAGVPATKLAAAVTRWWPDAQLRQARRLRLADAFDDKQAQDSAEPLLAVIADEREAPTLRGAAAVLLGLRFSARAGAIVPLLSARDPLLRAKACEALAVAHGRSAADLIFARTADDALMVRQAAALALAALGDARAEAALRTLAGAPASAHLVPPHFVLARMLAQRGELDDARRQLETVVELMPYHADALALLAQLLAARNQPAAARARADEALRFDPANRVALGVRERLPAP